MVIWQAILSEWVDFLIRWVHVIAGIAWIGSSFYFVHLDMSLVKRPTLPAGVAGEAWQVHGGGFYNMMKYVVAPPHMPEELTWFKWEAYATFLSGFALLVVHYYMNADLYLIDRTILPLAPWQAVGIGLLFLIVGWIAYDALCRSRLGQNDVALGVVLYFFLVLVGYALTRVFSGRGAFIELGALIGTAMVANVAMVIIPNQRKTVAQLIAGQTPDPKYGRVGKQRSLHNNYLTLPVIFFMVANHYPLAFASRYNWLIAAIVMIIGPVVRHFYNSRHARKGSPWWTWAVAAILVWTLIWLSWKGPIDGDQSSMQPAPGPVQFAQVQSIVEARCAVCHTRDPGWAGLGAPPKGVVLDTPDAIRFHARDIFIQAVATHAMPPGGNVTEISDADRRVLAAWIETGATDH